MRSHQSQQHKIYFVLIGLLSFSADAFAQPFATRMIDYSPAPGQFVNNPAFNDPNQALGPPVGGGTISPNNSGLVSLGGFGGSITLAFAVPVLDDPRNTMGLDFIVFGNAFWPGADPNARWAEAAIIEISLDVNNNGAADDPWYLIPGSHLTPPITFITKHWDNDPGTPTPPANIAWYPAGAPGEMTTSAPRLPAVFESFVLLNPRTDGRETYFGYADLSPTLILGDMTGATGAPGENSTADPEDNPAIDPAIFYTFPDNPFTVGVDPGAGGGDAFDIAWAIDPTTGAPANLPGFHFIRITNAVDAVGPLGEVSSEIDAVARVRNEAATADLNNDGTVDGVDLLLLLNAWGVGVSIADINRDGLVDGVDLLLLLNNWGPTP